MKKLQQRLSTHQIQLTLHQLHQLMHPRVIPKTITHIHLPMTNILHKRQKSIQMPQLMIPHPCHKSPQSPLLHLLTNLLAQDKSIECKLLHNRIPNSELHARYRWTFLEIFEFYLSLFDSLGISYQFVIFFGMVVAIPLPTLDKFLFKNGEHPMLHPDLVSRQRNHLILSRTIPQYLHIIAKPLPNFSHLQPPQTTFQYQIPSIIHRNLPSSPSNLFHPSYHD